MQAVNLLEFLNNAKNISTLEYAKCSSELFNFLNMLTEEEQFTKRIDFGVMYFYNKTANQYVVVDGLNRLLSVSLLLHALCECYKKTSAKNDKAIRTIRKKYLLDGTKTKLRLPKDEQVIYEKIIYGERLSGHEKKSGMFVLLHNFWIQIKEKGLSASSVLKMMQKIRIIHSDIENVSPRELYYSLNKNRAEINQLHLIENYLKELRVKEEWNDLKNIYNNKSEDLYRFFNDFFITKFNFKEFEVCRLYELFVNYFLTMMTYKSPKVIMTNMIKTASLYADILNVNFSNKRIKDAFIQIKMCKGEDTFAYLLNVYEDYVDNNITEGTLTEILNTIIEYLKNRQITQNDIGFNDLIQYLNAFITCK